MNTYAELPIERKWRVAGLVLANVGMAISIIAFIIFFIVKVFG